MKASLAVATACIFISQTANIIVPARLGDLVRIFILNHEYETPMSTGISSLVVERVFDIVMVALLGLITIPFVVNVPQWLILLVVIPLGIIAVLFLVLIIFGKIRSENRYVLLLLTMLEEIRKASLNIRSLLQFSVVSMIIWLLDITVCIFVVLMFSQQVVLPVVILAIVVGNLVKAIPVTPGGIGTYRSCRRYYIPAIGYGTGAGIYHRGNRSPDKEPGDRCRRDRIDLLLRRLGDNHHEIRVQQRTEGMIAQ